MSNDEDKPWNPAAGLEVPVMQPRGAELRGTPERRGYVERDRVREPVARGDEAAGAIDRTRMVGQRPVQGLGEPQPMVPAVILNQAHGFVEQYKRDPSKIDPLLVNIVTLEALATFGSQASKVVQLTGELARLRKFMEERWGEELDDEGPKRGSFRERLLARRAGGNGRARGRGTPGRGLRGRAAR